MLKWETPAKLYNNYCIKILTFNGLFSSNFSSVESGSLITKSNGVLSECISLQCLSIKLRLVERYVHHPHLNKSNFF